MYQAVLALYIALATQSVALVIMYAKFLSASKKLQWLIEFHQDFTEATMHHIFQLRAKHKDMIVPDDYR